MAGSEDASASFGSWKPSELAETVRAEAGVGADDGLPPNVRFKSNVAKLVRRRRAQPGAEADPLRPAIFLLQPTPPEFASCSDLKREPMLDNGMTTVNGRVWFVGPPVASGRFIDLEVADDEDMFRLVTDTLGLGATPTIVFDPRPSVPEVRFYANGLDNPDAYELVSLGEGEITLDCIFEAIDRVYEQCLVVRHG